ncbi:MAG: tetratricopeptide repeat protein, partial [Candidatus Eisenbacteria bacterium]|nr:tetratricopeptide repeat protein [Candidatus Latescibacterota bacterium]MBD3302632.1 tetratricopeptide repeat protein [Candidatus Eisenbacteria bacterium]
MLEGGLPLASHAPDSGRGTSPEELVDLLLGSGQTYLDQGQVEQADRCALHALDLARSGASEPATIRALVLLGRSRGAQDRNEEAVSSFEECLALQERTGDHAGAAATLCEIAGLRTREGEYRTAEDLLLESLRFSSADAPGPNRARALEELGSVRRLLGAFDVAMDNFREALRIREALRDRKGQARILNRLGNTYQRAGRLQEALDHQRRCLQLWEEIGDPRETGKVQNNLGTTYLEQGEYGASGECFERARALFDKLGDRPMLAHVLSNIGL